jgi:translin
MPSLKTLLNKIRKELKEKDRVREKGQKDMRKATRLSKQAILLIHQKRLDEAKKLIERAKEIISMLNDASTKYPEIIYSGLFNAARQEYSEANIFLSLIEESRFITPEEINVPSVDYVLGLADVIGECRRLALDALRETDVEKAEKCLQIMDEIYTELMGMDEAYMLVPGLRRKCDIARRIIETTRGDVTQEARRNSLEKYLKRFEKMAKRGRQAVRRANE